MDRITSASAQVKTNGGGEESVGAGLSPSPRQRLVAPHGTEEGAVQSHPAGRGTGRASAEGLPPPDRLLIVFAGGLGDLIMTLPLLSRAVKQCREVWLCALDSFDKWVGLVNLPKLRIIDERAAKDRHTPRFDAVIMTHSTPGGPPLHPDRMPARLGIAGRNHPFPCHATDANLEAGEMVGLREDHVREYPIAPPDGLLSIPSGMAVVCPGNSAQGEWRKKLLPHRAWPKITGLLRKDGMKVAGIDLYPPIVELDLDCSWWGELKPPGLAAVLAGAEVVVTVDCGVAHLSAALGTPTVVAWGPTSRTWSRPFGPVLSFVSRKGCGECLGTPLWKKCHVPSCMGIPAEAVMVGVREAIAQKGAAIRA